MQEQERELIPASEFCLHYHVEMNFIHSLQEYGLLETVVQEENIFIPTARLCELEKLARLHYDLNINMEGIDVILHLLQRLQEAQHEAAGLRNKLRMYSVE
jgi:hypothetical protein